ncbi:hypothetical protein OIE69_43590 (plasmid) [Actinacidiphila glaucinigra]|uniref:DNA polymerase Y family protein n=1 Tax=Actinacidiphila glaucinigra TaxID=235986 RepID=UPI002DDBAA68|nr:hypothetical protein [Actinacidiphila glaucinigra]WSD65793.1 hypothetical protein OIE69_43590 [Actinacidiphila glaucinigra]
MDDEAACAERGAHILHVRIMDRRVPDTPFRELLALLGDVTPVVQPLPPAAALANVRGAMRYWDRTPYELALRIRTRALGVMGLPLQVGVGPTWAVAAMASAHPGHGGIRVIPDDHKAMRAFLDPLPVADLYGVGPAQAATLDRYGLRTVGQVARLPLETLQRVLEGRVQARLVHERARGIDLRPVVATALPQSISSQRSLDGDTLDPNLVHTEILHAVVDVAHQLREREQVARVLTLGVAFAGGSSVNRSRTLTEATAYTDDLRAVAVEVFERMGLQRARVRGVSVRVEQLTSADDAPMQLSLDPQRENGHRLDPVVDAVNARFGPGTVTWAPLAHRRRSA